MKGLLSTSRLSLNRCIHKVGSPYCSLSSMCVFSLPLRCTLDLRSSGMLRSLMVGYRRFGTNFRPLQQESSSLNNILELLDPLNMWPIRFPETSVNNYLSNMRNIPEERTFMKSSPFWNVTRCRLVVGYRLFGTNYRSLHQ